MIIPWDSLTEETLDALITEFILREGTDYGQFEVPLAVKIDQIKEQLKIGNIVIVWSELHETVNIMPKSHFSG